MAKLHWVPLAESWQAACQGGWLVLSHWRLQAWALAWREITAINWLPSIDPRQPAMVVLRHQGGERRVPCCELSAARLRRWWHEALEARAALPRHVHLPDLLARPMAYGGRRFVSELQIHLSSAGSYAVVGTEPAPARDQRLRVVAASPAADALQTASEGPVLRTGQATFIFDWERPTLGRRRHTIGTVYLERFESLTDQPLTPPDTGTGGHS